MSLLIDHARDLQSLASRARLRTLSPVAGIDFASNDYLALASDARLRDAITAAAARGVPAGSGGSRLLRGNHPEIEALEAEAAAFFRAGAALFFANGYLANLALLATLPQRGDLILHDAAIHASAHDGMRLSRAPVRSVRHNDAQGFEDAIHAWRREGGTGRPWLAVESLYSMDGDQAPLGDLLAVAERHDAMLLVDEAHATGVFGSRGAGLAERFEGYPRLITLHTCGKALGCEGALVCGDVTMRDFLVNRARTFIFTTAPSPLMAAAVRESLRSLADEPERRTQLHALIALAEQVLAPHGVSPTGSQILPLILGDDRRTMEVAARLQAAGFDVRGIRPPTVPEGRSRLRISLTLNADADDIAALGAALAEALR